MGGQLWVRPAQWTGGGYEQEEQLVGQASQELLQRGQPHLTMLSARAGA